MLLQTYLAKTSDAILAAEATSEAGALVVDDAIHLIRAGLGVGRRGRKVFVVGNGGSAAISSHVAVDLNRAGVRAIALNDGSALTCAANDFGYDQVFAKQVEWCGDSGDAMIAISSSGQSASILNAVAMAKRSQMFVATFSGFMPHNPLRKLGNVNIWVPSVVYGYVELAHHLMLHKLTDDMLNEAQILAGLS